METFVINNKKFEQIKMFNDVMRDVENTSGRTIKNFILLSFAYYEKNDSTEEEDLKYEMRIQVTLLIEKKFSKENKKSYIKAVYREFYSNDIEYEENHIDLSKEEVEKMKEEYYYIW